MLSAVTSTVSTILSGAIRHWTSSARLHTKGRRPDPDSSPLFQRKSISGLLRFHGDEVSSFHFIFTVQSRVDKRPFAEVANTPDRSADQVSEVRKPSKKKLLTTFSARRTWTACGKYCLETKGEKGWRTENTLV